MTNTAAPTHSLFYNGEEENDQHEKVLHQTATNGPDAIVHMTQGLSPSYPANVAAACYQSNCTINQESPQDSATIGVEDEFKLEKRRQSNRLSAQRWRMRKRTKFTELQDKIRELQNDHDELERERSKLQAELQLQLSLAQAEAAQLSSNLIAARLRSSQQALQVSRNMLLRDKFHRLTTGTTPILAQGFALTGSNAFSAPVDMFSLKTPSSYADGQFLKQAFDQTILEQSGAANSGSLTTMASNAQLRDMLRAAVGPYNALQR